MRLVRNTYNIVASSATADQYEIELHVYTGTQTTDRPATPTATILTSMIPALNQTNNYAIVDISPYIMDEMDIRMTTGSLISRVGVEEGVWFDYRVRTITAGTPASWGGYISMCATPGYGLYTDEDTNFALYTNNGPMLSAGTTIYIPSGERLIIPISDWDSSGSSDETTFYNGTTHTTAFATPGNATDTGDVVQYVQEPVAQDTIALYRFDGVSTYTEKVKIERVSDPNGQSNKIWFVNRYGAIQEMWFFGRRNDGFRTTGISARRDTKWYVSFQDERHQYVDFNKNARERITLNSGWQVEANNQLFRELLMSQQIWIYDDTIGTNAIPIRVTSSDLQLKSQRWDRLINYTIEFEKAYDYALE